MHRAVITLILCVCVVLSQAYIYCINRFHTAVVEIYKLEQAATGSSVICDTNRDNSSEAKQKHILPTKPRKITTNIIHLLKRIVG